MITLTINGKQQRYDGDPEMPLLWVLRDELNLKGAKFVRPFWPTRSRTHTLPAAAWGCGTWCP